MDNYQISPLLETSKPQTYVEQLLASYQSLLDNSALLTLDINQNKAVFDSSDYVWLIFSNDFLGYLSLPSQTGNKCSYGPPLNLFINKKSKCVQTSSSIQSQCSKPNSKTPLSISYFVGKFAIIQVVSILNFRFDWKVKKK